MATWHEYLIKEGRPPAWPYPVRFGQEREIDTDVLVIGGGIAGCWAAISAARQGVRVALLEKGDAAAQADPAAITGARPANPHPGWTGRVGGTYTTTVLQWYRIKSSAGRI